MSSLLGDLVAAALATVGGTHNDGTKRGRYYARMSLFIAFGIMAVILSVVWYIGSQDIDAKKTTKLQEMAQVSETYKLSKSLEAIKAAKADGVVSNMEYDKIKRHYTQESFDKNYELKQKNLAQKNS